MNESEKHLYVKAYLATALMMLVGFIGIYLNLTPTQAEMLSVRLFSSFLGTGLTFIVLLSIMLEHE